MILLTTPSKRQRFIGITYLIFTLFVSISIYLFNYYMTDNFYFTAQLFLIFFIITVTYFTCNNILFFFRLLLLAVIPLGTSLAILLDLKAANFGAIYQTIFSSKIIVFCGFLSINASLFGWLLIKENKILLEKSIHIKKKNKNPLLIFFILLLAIFFFVRSGGIVGADNTYANPTNSVSFIGSLNAIFYFFISKYLVDSKNYYPKKRLLFCGVICLIITLTGSRADFLLQGFVLIFSALFFKGNFFTIKNIFFGFFLLIFSLVISNFIGEWRNGNTFIFDSARDFFIDERNAGKVLVLSTANQMIGTFYAVIGKIHLSSESNFLYGSSYFDYFYRSIPGFLAENRPLSLAYKMFVNETQMSQGGIFEVSEAYFNFGILGAFFVPFVISLTLRLLLFFSNNTKVKIKSIYSICFLSMSFMSPRAIWYQTFVYWRVITVVIVLYLIIYFCFYFIKKGSNPEYISENN